METYNVGVNESGDDELVAGQADELNASKDWWQNDDRYSANMLITMR
jgi:hypothetical protein